jgi:hypothetical protein
VLRCGRAIAVLQSRENLYEKQPFSVDLPRWITGLKARPDSGGVRLHWDRDPAAQWYRVWRRLPGATVYPQWQLAADGLTENSWLLAGLDNGTFGVTAKTRATRRLEGTLNYTEYLLFTAEESPILEQAVVTKDGARTEQVSWTDASLPASQEIWRIFKGVQPGREPEAQAVLEAFGELISAFETQDLDRLMACYDPEYRDSNGYSTQYVRRAWRWWYQRTVVPYVVAQVRQWDTTGAPEGVIRFTAWNRFRGTMIWDEPFGCHGRVRIPRHDDERVTWTWRRNAQGRWKLLSTSPALPNLGEMLWNSRGHDRPHTMSDFADTPAK